MASFHVVAHPQTNVNLTYLSSTGDRYAGFDTFGRVIDQNWLNTSSGATVDRFKYGYDRDGDVLYKQDNVVAANSELYHANSATSGDSNTAYDGLGRITGFARGTLSSSGNNGSTLDKIVSPSWTQAWTLDAWGNWNSQSNGGTATTRTFNAQNQTATSTTGSTPVYDYNGNEVKDTGGDSYTYDAWNRPILHTVLGTSTVIAQYTYDALGRRIIASYPNSSGAPIKNLYYSPGGQVIEERWGSSPTGSAVMYQYVWSLAGGNTMVLRDQFGTVTQRLYVEQDANGNVTSLTDNTGAVVERFLYDPYGVYTFMNAAGTGAGTNPVGWEYMFQGGRVDIATGRVNFGFRDYIPFEGKWAQRDPLGQAAGDNNIYGFVGENPVAFVDPMGLNKSWHGAEGQAGSGAGRTSTAMIPVGGWENPYWVGATEFFPAILTTFLSGEAADSVNGLGASAYNHFLAPVAGLVTGKDMRSDARPTYGHDDAFENGYFVGELASVTADLVMIAYSLPAIAALELPALAFMEAPLLAGLGVEALIGGSSLWTIATAAVPGILGGSLYMSAWNRKGEGPNYDGPADAPITPRNSAQDKLLSKGEIKKLQDAGHDVHELKGGKGASRYDLYKDKDGNIYVKRKGNLGDGDSTGININEQ